MKQFIIAFLFSICLAATSFSQELLLNSALISEWSNVSEQVENIKNSLPKINTPQLVQCATCFCKVSYDNLSGEKNATGVCLDLTGVVNKQYCGWNRQSLTNQQDCSQRCTNAVSALTAAQKQAVADCMCSNGKPTGARATAYSAVGTKEYNSAAPLGTLTNSPAIIQTTCTCPQGWLSNTNNQNGGITTDGKCKKAVCGPIVGCDPLPNGTPIGNWGFTWDNWIYTWGTPTNGGKPNCVSVTLFPRVCKLN